MNAKHFTFLSILLLGCLGLSAVASAATIAGSDLKVYASDTGWSDTYFSGIAPSLLPTTTSDSITKPGSSASATYTLTSNSFRVDFSGTRNAGIDAYASANGSIGFNLASAVTYTVTGSFTANDADAASRVTLLELVDSGAKLFNNQTSVSTADESLVVGGTAGDNFNVMNGSLTGTLLPGSHNWGYQLTAFNFDPDGGATFSGFAQIQFTEIATEGVPEPSTFVLGAVALISVGLLALRKKVRRV